MLRTVLFSALLAVLVSLGCEAWAGGPGTGWLNAPAQLPDGIRVFRNVRYGNGDKQSFDVYSPAKTRNAPVIFMVHGGAWQFGSKAARGVVEAKVAHWVPRGFVFISTDYPMLPETKPLQQAQAVALALAAAQHQAATWGADPKRFILMGHSAGAHLVALISARPSLATSQGAAPWLGSVALDSAAYNIATIMHAKHYRLYDRAFGDNPATWTSLSPIVQLQKKIAPFLAVCSSRRSNSCPQARAFVDKAKRLGARAELLPVDLSHLEINAQLGLPSAYTAKVDAFLASLCPAIAAQLR